MVDGGATDGGGEDGGGTEVAGRGARGVDEVDVRAGKGEGAAADVDEARDREEHGGGPGGRRGEWGAGR